MSILDADGPRRPDHTFSEVIQLLVIRDTFLVCHGLPGVYSFNSLPDFRAGLSRNEGNRLRPLVERSVADVADAVVKWKEGTTTWKTLRKMMAD